MAGDYGFRDRPDDPYRLIKVPPQAAARNTLPRAVDAAIKRQQEAGSLFAIEQLMTADSVNPMVGFVADSVSEGGGGSTTITDAAWWSDISRFCRYVEINATGTNNKRINRTGLAFNISPLAILDPSQPPAPWIHWFEDIVAARLSSPSSSHRGAFYFGQTWENGIGVALVAPKPFIGIYANWSGTAYGTWTARCVDDSGSGLDHSLGITTEKPHRLAYGLDGRGVVHFCIDGVELYTYTTTGSDLGTHTIFEAQHRWTVAGDDGATIKAGYFMDYQAIVSVEVLDEAA